MCSGDGTGPSGELTKGRVLEPWTERREVGGGVGDVDVGRRQQ